MSHSSSEPESGIHVSAYTEGPWQICENRGGHRIYIRAANFVETVAVITDVTERSKNDARLIVAALPMLNSLIALREALGPIANELFNATGMHTASDLKVLARKMIDAFEPAHKAIALCGDGNESR